MQDDTALDTALFRGFKLFFLLCPTGDTFLFNKLGAMQPNLGLVLFSQHIYMGLYYCTGE
jgi:hypothetical protein